MPVVQTVTATREPKLDFSNPTAPKTTGYSDWTTPEFDVVPVKIISGYLATSDAVSALTVNADTTDAATSDTITYKKITGGYTYQTPDADQPTTTAWPNDPIDPAKLTNGTVPAIDGYTPMINDTPLTKDPTTGEYIVPVPDSTDPTASVAIVYQADTNSVTVQFVDQNNQTIDSKPAQQFTGKVGADVNYTTDGAPIDKAIDGYVLTDDDTTASVKYGTTPITLTIKYQQITGRYDISVPNAENPITQAYDNNPNDPKAVAPGTTPNIPGYTAYVDGSDTPLTQDPNGNYIIPAPSDAAGTTNVIFKANTQTLTVNFNGNDGTKVAASQTFKGTTGSDIDFDHDDNGVALHKYQPNWLLTEDKTAGLSTFSTAAQTIDLIYTKVTGKYTITPAAGDTTTPDHIDFTVDTDVPTQYAKQTVPVVSGYTPVVEHDGGKPTDLVIDPDDPTQYLLPTPTTNDDIAIKYVADTQKLIVHYQFNGGAKADYDVELTGDSHAPVDFSTLTKVVDGYILTSDPTTSPMTYDSIADQDQQVTLIYTVSGEYTVTTPDTKTTDPKIYTTDPKQPNVATGTVPYQAGYTPATDNGTVTLVDPDDPTKGYILTPEHPTELAKITYTIDDQTVTVHFVMPTGVTVPDDATLTGASGSKVDYSKTIKPIAEYVYVAGQSQLVENFDFDSSKLQTATVVYAASSNYTYTTPDTNTTTTTAYTTDGTNPSVATGHVPYAPGYTPQIDDKDIPLVDPKDPSKGYDFTPSNPTTPTEIKYVADQQKVIVHFDKAGKIDAADDQTFTGASDTAVDFSTLNKKVEGYILTTDPTTTPMNYDHVDDDQAITLVYTAIGQYIVTTPDNRTTPETSYVNDPNDPTKATATIPYIQGYTPKSDNGTTGFTVGTGVDGKQIYTFTPADPTKPATIEYVAQDTTIDVFFVTYQDGKRSSVPGYPSVTLKGKTGENIDYRPVDKLIVGYTLKTDGTETTKIFTGESEQATDIVYVPSSTFTVKTPTGSETTPTQYVTTTDNPKIATATIPNVPGYLPTATTPGEMTPTTDTFGNVTGYKFTPTDPTQPAEITYTAQETSMQVTFMAGQISIHKPQTFTGKTGEGIVYKDLNKVTPGYVLINDGTDTVKFFSGDPKQTAVLTYAQTSTYTAKTPVGDITTPVQYTTDPKNPDKATGIVPDVPGYTPTLTGVAFTPVDPTDLAKGYTFTPTDPTQAVEVTYAADPASIKVAFVDAKGDPIPNTQVQTFTDKTGATIDYTELHKVVAGYVLTDDETVGVDTYTVENNGTTLKLTYQQTTGGYTGMTPSGTDLTTPYITNEDDPKTVDPLNVPYVEGYTPTSDNGDVTPVKDPEGNITSYTLIPADPARKANVTYGPDTQQVTVHFETTNSAEIHPSVDLKGVSDEAINYSTIDKQLTGYVLEDDGTLTMTKYDTDDDTDQSVILTYAALGDGVAITTPTGEKATTPYTNDSTDPKDPKTVDPIAVPDVPGYTPISDNGSPTLIDSDDPSLGYTLTPTNPAIATNVTYTADAKSINVAFIDESDKPLQDAQHLTGVTDGNIDYTTIDKVIDGYVLVHDETVGKTKFSAADNGKNLAITYKQTNGGFTVTTPGSDQPTHTDYQTDPKDPQTVVPMTVQSLPGYTPHTDNGELKPNDPGDSSKDYTLIPADPTKPTNVIYTADAKSINVAFVDEDNVALKNSKHFDGVTDGDIGLTVADKVVSGYVLTADETANKTKFSATDNGETFTITYEPISTGLTLTTPDPDDPDGKQATKLTPMTRQIHQQSCQSMSLILLVIRQLHLIKTVSLFQKTQMTSPKATSSRRATQLSQLMLPIMLTRRRLKWRLLIRLISKKLAVIQSLNFWVSLMMQLITRSSTS